MTKEEMISLIRQMVRETPGNIIEMAGKKLRLYDEPLIGFGDAHDPLFTVFKKEDVIGPWHKSPVEWLPAAQSVISLFFPFSKEVKASNAAMRKVASTEWVYGRVEGQAYIAACTQRICDYFIKNQTEACVPSLDARFFRINTGVKRTQDPADPEDGTLCPGADANTFSSNWSERHAAFICGLGTFGMSRGLITEKGMAGRFGSIITAERLEADRREYSDLYEYCIKCGACSFRCPAGAIPRSGLKDHSLCAPVIAASRKMFAPRYGCGLCQTAVPCQDGIPARIQSGNSYNKEL